MAGRTFRRWVDDNPNTYPYEHPEDFLSNVKLVSVNSGTEYGFGVVLLDASGNPIYPAAPGASIVDGTTTVTTAGTAVRITATPTPIKGVWLSGDTIAGILLYVGASSVVANVSGQRGLCIIPGNNPVFLEVSDLSLVYVDAVSNGGKLAWAYTV